ncbi:MAG: hypothetical protein S4CHLAM2_04740 [Chlamydiales bacterium]|nr:hypothetical protein [Chlamydiales bacterium]
MTAAADDALRMATETQALIERGLDEFTTANGRGELRGRSVVLVGKTGKGKTTLILMIAGKTLKAVYDKPVNKMRIKAEPPVPGFEIGENTLSKTSVPRRLTVGEMTVWDCPGFFDNRGVTHEIANAVLTQKVFNESQEVKIVLVVKHSEIQDDDRGTVIIELVKTLNSMTRGEIHSSTTLVATCAGADDRPEPIQTMIQRVINEQLQAGQPEHTLLHGLNSNPISLFPKPVKDQESAFVDSAREAILRNIEATPYARDVSANLTISPQGYLTLNALYKGLHGQVSELVGTFATRFTGATHDFVNRGGNTQQALEAILAKLNSIFEKDYAIAAVPQIVQACLEIVQSCEGTVEDCSESLVKKVETLHILEKFMHQDLCLALDIVASIRAAVKSVRIEVEKAVIEIKAKDAEEKARLETERAKNEKTRADEEVRKRQASEQLLRDLEARNKALYNQKYGGGGGAASARNTMGVDVSVGYSSDKGWSFDVATGKK